LLEVNGLVVNQGDFVLKADFSLKPGDMVAVIGPSGGGKSTLLSTIAGFINVDSGSVFLNDLQISKLLPSEVPCTLLFQDNNLFPHLNVFNNVGIGINSKLKLNNLEKDKVVEVLKRVELLDHLEKKPSELSGGQISRVALARALLRRKPLLMLDEAFGALGPAQRLGMLKYVEELVRTSKSILLMVTHDPIDAWNIANKVIFVEDGLVSRPMDVKRFFNKPTENVERYLGLKRVDII
jgi:thiamine transport system ATP-binding protein